MKRTTQDIASGLLRHLAAPADESEKAKDYWAWLCIEEMIEDGDAHDAWAIILRAIQLASSDRDLKFIGAGVLESLLHRRGPEVVERIEEAVEQDARVLTALKAAYLSDSDEHVLSTVKSLVARHC